MTPFPIKVATFEMKNKVDRTIKKYPLKKRKKKKKRREADGWWEGNELKMTVEKESGSQKTLVIRTAKETDKEGNDCHDAR